MFDDLKKDQASQPQGSSAPMSKKIDDMFADVDPAPQPKPLPNPAPMPATERPSAIQSGKIKPISPNQNINIPVAQQNNQAPFMGPLPQAGESINGMTAGRKLVIIFSVLMLLIIVGGLVYYFFFKNRPEITEDFNQNINVNINENQNINNNQNTNSNQNSNTNDIIIIDEATLDDDFDGLTNLEEIELGTNPYESDTDNDGVFDQDEVEVYRTNPLLDDSDSDELGDFEEIITYGTDPNDPDSDDDGYMDGVEVLNGYNPRGSGLLEDMEPVPPKNTNTNENNQ